MRRRPGGAIGRAPSNGSPEAWESRCRTVAPGGPAGSSRSTTPSSAATSVASAATGFETEASSSGRVESPRVAIVPAARVTPAVANGTSQPSISPNACTEARYYPGDGASPDHGALALRGGGRILPGGGRRLDRARRGDRADPAGRITDARERLRAGSALPLDHRPGARPRRLVPRGRRPDADVRHRRGALARGGAGPRRGICRRAPGGHLRDHLPARPDVEGRDRGGRGAAVTKQVVPPDIMGPPGSGAGSRASVLDHRFGRGDLYTLGVEEEYQLLDPTTFDLVQHIDTVLAAVEGHELESQINPELMQSVLEIATPVCRSPADVMRELVKLRGYVCGVAREKNLRVGSAGTHPFSLFERQRITAKDRYRQLVDQLQYVARRELIFGMHVHVGVDGPEKAIQVVNGMLAQIPQLLALSASSPFWRGEPTGLASTRQLIFAAFPRSGPPPRFRDYADYAEVVGQLERTGCIADYTHIWWDVRPHPRLGTVEMRVCDAVTRLEDVAAIAALFQAIVKMYSEQ